MSVHLFLRWASAAKGNVTQASSFASVCYPTSTAISTVPSRRNTRQHQHQRHHHSIQSSRRYAHTRNTSSQNYDEESSRDKNSNNTSHTNDGIEIRQISPTEFISPEFEAAENLITSITTPHLGPGPFPILGSPSPLPPFPVPEKTTSAPGPSSSSSSSSSSLSPQPDPSTSSTSSTSTTDSPFVSSKAQLKEAALEQEIINETVSQNLSQARELVGLDFGHKKILSQLSAAERDIEKKRNELLNATQPAEEVALERKAERIMSAQDVEANARWRGEALRTGKFHAHIFGEADTETPTSHIRAKLEELVARKFRKVVAEQDKAESPVDLPVGTEKVSSTASRATAENARRLEKTENTEKAEKTEKTGKVGKAEKRNKADKEEGQSEDTSPISAFLAVKKGNKTPLERVVKGEDVLVDLNSPPFVAPPEASPPSLSRHVMRGLTDVYLRKMAGLKPNQLEGIDMGPPTLYPPGVLTPAKQSKTLSVADDKSGEPILTTQHSKRELYFARQKERLHHFLREQKKAKEKEKREVKEKERREREFEIAELKAANLIAQSNSAYTSQSTYTPTTEAQRNARAKLHSSGKSGHLRGPMRSQQPTQFQAHSRPHAHTPVPLHHHLKASPPPDEFREIVEDDHELLEGLPKAPPRKSTVVNTPTFYSSYEPDHLEHWGAGNLYASHHPSENENHPKQSLSNFSKGLGKEKSSHTSFPSSTSSGGTSPPIGSSRYSSRGMPSSQTSPNAQKIAYWQGITAPISTSGSSGPTGSGSTSGSTSGPSFSTYAHPTPVTLSSLSTSGNLSDFIRGLGKLQGRDSVDGLNTVVTVKKSEDIPSSPVESPWYRRATRRHAMLTQRASAFKKVKAISDWRRSASTFSRVGDGLGSLGGKDRLSGKSTNKKGYPDTNTEIKGKGWVMRETSTSTIPQLQSKGYLTTISVPSQMNRVRRETSRTTRMDMTGHIFPGEPTASEMMRTFRKALSARQRSRKQSQSEQPSQVSSSPRQQSQPRVANSHRHPGMQKDPRSMPRSTSRPTSRPTSRSSSMNTSFSSLQAQTQSLSRSSGGLGRQTSRQTSRQSSLPFLTTPPRREFSSSHKVWPPLGQNFDNADADAELEAKEATDTNAPRVTYIPLAAILEGLKNHAEAQAQVQAQPQSQSQSQADEEKRGDFWNTVHSKEYSPTSFQGSPQLVRVLRPPLPPMTPATPILPIEPIPNQFRPIPLRETLSSRGDPNSLATSFTSRTIPQSTHQPNVTSQPFASIPSLASTTLGPIPSSTMASMPSFSSAYPSQTVRRSLSGGSFTGVSSATDSNHGELGNSSRYGDINPVEDSKDRRNSYDDGFDNNYAAFIGQVTRPERSIIENMARGSKTVKWTYPDPDITPTQRGTSYPQSYASMSQNQTQSRSLNRNGNYDGEYGEFNKYNRDDRTSQHDPREQNVQNTLREQTTEERPNHEMDSEYIRNVAQNGLRSRIPLTHVFPHSQVEHPQVQDDSPFQMSYPQSSSTADASKEYSGSSTKPTSATTSAGTSLGSREKESGMTTDYPRRKSTSRRPSGEIQSDEDLLLNLSTGDKDKFVDKANLGGGMSGSTYAGDTTQAGPMFWNKTSTDPSSHIPQPPPVHPGRRANPRSTSASAVHSHEGILRQPLTSSQGQATVSMAHTHANAGWGSPNHSLAGGFGGVPLGVGMTLEGLQNLSAPSTGSITGATTSTVANDKKGKKMNPPSVIGSHFAQFLDFRNATAGQFVTVPYENTVRSGDLTSFNAAFPEFNRLHTSASFAMTCGLEDTPLPAGFLLSHATAMSHVDSSGEVLEVQLDKAQYLRPVYAGDTLSKLFVVKSLKPTSSGKHTIATIHCQLLNQRHETVFMVEKKMVCYGVVNQYYSKSNTTNSSANPSTAVPTAEKLKDLPFAKAILSSTFEELSSPTPSNASPLLLHTILENAGGIRFPQSRSITPGQLILHTAVRPMGTSRHLSFCGQFRINHPMHSNFARYSPAELIVPGSLVLALTHSAANRALFEVLYEEVSCAQFIAKVSPWDAVGGMTLIVSSADIPGHPELSEVTVVTIGLKNVDVVRALEEKPIPVELFTRDMSPKQMNSFLAENLPHLQGKVVCRSVRKLIRQSLYSRDDNLPLL